MLQYKFVIDKLVRQELILHSRGIYYFSKDQSCIEKATSDTDFVYGLYCLLQRYADVALALYTMANVAQRSSSNY
jgi:hypothetical protein